MVLAVAVGLIIVVLFLPRILESLQDVLDERSDTEKKQDREEEKLKQETREDEGAILTGARVIFGDDVIDAQLEASDEIFGKSQEEKIKQVEKNATEIFGKNVQFAGDVEISKDGVISGAPLVTDEYLEFLNKQNKKIQESKKVKVNVTPKTSASRRFTSGR